METGINHFIFISALLFGIGLYVLLTAKEAVRVIIGLSMLFTSSILNIAAFAGFWNFNPESQIIIFVIAVVCLLNIITGVILFFRHYKVYKTNIFDEVSSVE